MTEPSFLYHLLHRSLSLDLFERTTAEPRSSMKQLAPSYLDQGNGLSFSGLEANSRPCSDVEMRTVREKTIEDESRVRLKKGVVRADLVTSMSSKYKENRSSGMMYLDRSVPSVLDFDEPSSPLNIESDFLFPADNCAWEVAFGRLEQREEVGGGDRQEGTVKSVGHYIDKLSGIVRQRCWGRLTVARVGRYRVMHGHEECPVLYIISAFDHYHYQTNGKCALDLDIMDRL